MLLVGTNGGDRQAAAASRDCIQQNVDAVGGPIDLVDSNGAHITQADFAGEPAVIYFGFTHCPDVCPSTMYTLAEALAAPGGYDVQPILITVDPERDTPQRMGEYTHTDGFPPGLVGLSGTRAQIDAATGIRRGIHAAADARPARRSSQPEPREETGRTRWSEPCSPTAYRLAGAGP